MPLLLIMQIFVEIYNLLSKGHTMEYITAHFLKGISEHVARIVEMDMILNALSPKLQAGGFFFC